MSQAAVKQLAEVLKDQPANPLRPHQVEEYQAEASRLKELVHAPAYVTGADRGNANERYRQVNKILVDQAPKSLGANKDKTAKLLDEVLETVIKPALLPREEMRRNPAGAVGKFLKTENSKEIQGAIQHWKRGRLALEEDNPDPDLANVEVYRPEKIHDTGGVSTFAAGAQIPGNFAMTPKAKENWPLGEPLVETPLKQAQKRDRTPSQVAALKRAQAAAKAKREQVV